MGSANGRLSHGYITRARESRVRALETRMYDDRKQDKTGPLSLDQAKARALGTGIGQSKKAAMMTGEARATRVADCIPASQKKAVAGCDTGYPKPMTDCMDAPLGTAMQGPLAIGGRRR